MCPWLIRIVIEISQMIWKYVFVCPDWKTVCVKLKIVVVYQMSPRKVQAIYLLID